MPTYGQEEVGDVLSEKKISACFTRAGGMTFKSFPCHFLSSDIWCASSSLFKDSPTFFYTSCEFTTAKNTSQVSFADSDVLQQKHKPLAL